MAPRGNKNEALPVLSACLLVEGEIAVENIPQIGRVGTLLDALRGLGARVSRGRAGEVTVDTSPLLATDPDPALASRIRGSVLLTPGLLARTGRAVLPHPGGDRRFRGAEVFLDETSVTATENTVLAAVLAEGTTHVLNAACEPHVQGLCRFLYVGIAPCARPGGRSS